MALVAVLGAALATTGAAQAPFETVSDDCAPKPLLPAYAHNDYRGPRPLTDAIRLGLGGVEVDLFREGGELRVGHDRRDLSPGQTLQRLYLDPLAARATECGFIVAADRPFLLNLELKEVDPRAFAQLLAELQTYETPLFEPPLVEVVMVGWWPTPPRIGTPWPPYLGVQLAWEDRDDEARARAGDRIRLLSVDHSKSLRWSGHGRPSRRADHILAAAVDLAETLEVPVRVHQAPLRTPVFRWILGHGVDLIGIKDVELGVTALTTG